MADTGMSFGDVILKILLKWRTFLISMIIVGVIFGIVGFIRNSGNESQMQEPVGTTTLDSLRAPLAESEQKSIELAADNYLLLQELLEEKEEHLRHSIRMKIDYENVSVMTVTYRIESKNQAVYPIMNIEDVTSDIIDLYLKKVLNNDTYEMIISETGWDVDADCVKELIATEKGVKELFTIQVIACNEDECIKMISVIKSRIDEVTKAVSENYGEYDIALVNELYSENVNTELLREKLNRNNEIIAIKSEMDAIDDVLSAEGLAYYEALVNGSSENSVAQENVEGAETNSSTLGLDLKYVLVGVVAGGALVFIYVLFMYMCSTRLHTAEELTQLIGVTVLGSVCKDSKKKKIMQFVDNFIYRLFGIMKSNEEEQIEIVSSNIRVAMKKRAYQKVCLVTSCNDEDVEKVIEELNAKTCGDLIEVHAGVDVLKNAEMLEKMLMSDCVVIVEKESVSKYMDIKRVAELCETHQIGILGSVVVKELS